jgi:hypothetical protein
VSEKGFTGERGIRRNVREVSDHNVVFDDCARVHDATSPDPRAWINDGQCHDDRSCTNFSEPRHDGRRVNERYQFKRIG